MGIKKQYLIKKKKKKRKRKQYLIEMIVPSFDFFPHGQAAWHAGSDQELNPGPPWIGSMVLTTGPPGNSLEMVMDLSCPTRD